MQQRTPEKQDTINCIVNDLEQVIRHYFNDEKIVTILGASGTGKTLLAKHVLGMDSVPGFYSLPYKECPSKSISGSDINLERDFKDGIILDDISVVRPDTEFHLLLNISIEKKIPVILISQIQNELDLYIQGREDVVLLDINHYYN